MVGGAPMPQALMERLEQRLGVERADQLGHDRAVAAGHGDAAATIPIAQRRRPAGRRSASICCSPMPTGGHCPSSAERRAICACAAQPWSSAISAQDEPATDADGWFDTGDLAVIDDDGNLSITGRAKDLIKSGGEWINPAEIEAIVGALPRCRWSR